MKLDFVAPKAVGRQSLTLFFMCDSYMGCDQVRRRAREGQLGWEAGRVAAAAAGVAGGKHSDQVGLPVLRAVRMHYPAPRQSRPNRCLPPHPCPLQEFELDLDIKEGAASDDEQPEQMDQD